MAEVIIIMAFSTVALSVILYVIATIVTKRDIDDD